MLNSSLLDVTVRTDTFWCLSGVLGVSPYMCDTCVTFGCLTMACGCHCHHV